MIDRDYILDGLQQTYEQAVTTFDQEVISQLIDAFLESDSMRDIEDVLDAVFEDTFRMTSKAAMYTKDCINDIIEYYG